MISQLLHLAATPELKKNTFPSLLHYSSPGPTSVGQRWMENATNIQPLVTAAHHNVLTVTLQGKARKPHWSQRIKPENLYSVGSSSFSNSSRTVELFVLSNILLQVKLLQRNSTYKNISCLLRVYPVLRVLARTFRCQSQKGSWFYLHSIQKQTFSKSHWNTARVTEARSCLSTKDIWMFTSCKRESFQTCNRKLLLPLFVCLF